MGKKSKNKFPKRIAGLKVPKGLRRFASSPLGAAIIADGTVRGAMAVAKSPRAEQMRNDAADQGANAWRFIKRTVEGVLVSTVATAQDIVEKAEAQRAERRGEQRQLGGPEREVEQEPEAYEEGPPAPGRSERPYTH